MSLASLDSFAYEWLRVMSIAPDECLRGGNQDIYRSFYQGRRNFGGLGGHLTPLDPHSLRPWRVPWVVAQGCALVACNASCSQFYNSLKNHNHIIMKITVYKIFNYIIQSHHSFQTPHIRYILQNIIILIYSRVLKSIYFLQFIIYENNTSQWVEYSPWLHRTYDSNIFPMF